jgi:hypothetical protein
MDALLTQVATARDPLWRGLAWRIARAWRRISRVVTLTQLLLARRLAVQPALPAPARYLPNPDLSKTLQSIIMAALKRVRDQPVGLFGRLGRMLGQAGGNRRHWRLR